MVVECVKHLTLRRPSSCNCDLAISSWKVRFLEYCCYGGTKNFGKYSRRGMASLVCYKMMHKVGINTLKSCACIIKQPSWRLWHFFQASSKVKCPPTSTAKYIRTLERNWISLKVWKILHAFLSSLNQVME